MAVVALFWQAAVTSASSVTVKDNEIWLQTASGQRQLTRDGVPKRLPTLSPAGDAVAYVVDHRVSQNAPEELIVLVDMSGEVRQRIVPEGYVPRDFERLDWLDDQRIGAMACGHANCMYWVLNPDSGKTIGVMRGGFDFIWSHNRQFVARRFVASWCAEHAPEGTCPEQDAVLLNRDEVDVYPPERAAKQFDDSHSHEIGIGTGPPFAWSPDDKWVAFTDLIGPEDDWYVVILSPTGKMLRDSVPVDPDYGAALEWLDDTHLDLRAGKRTFHFAMQGSEFSEVPDAR
ncbi:MAG TPA: hypothetical protein VL240_13060 [Candidatus Binatia bacterium]|nr:hypothetical protein [Candidatus Binatia bacterium]